MGRDRHHRHCHPSHHQGHHPGAEKAPRSGPAATRAWVLIPPPLPLAAGLGRRGLLAEALLPGLCGGGNENVPTSQGSCNNGVRQEGLGAQRGPE